jgi:hypothetical protein
VRRDSDGDVVPGEPEILGTFRCGTTALEVHRREDGTSRCFATIVGL